MECVLAGLTPEHSLINLDDIIVFSAIFQEHLSHLRGVLDSLLTAGLRVKTSNCQFAQKEVEYLDHVVLEHGIYSDSRKIEAFRNYQQQGMQRNYCNFLASPTITDDSFATMRKLQSPCTS